MKKTFIEPLTFPRLMNIAYLAAVSGILLFPSLGLDLKQGLIVDNRQAERFPVWSTDGFTGIPRQFELWFGDRFGGRRNCISWGNWILYHVFQESPNEQILIGRDGFLFFASHAGGKENRNSLVKQLFLYSNQQVASETMGFARHLDIFSKSQTHLLFMNVPTKHFLYYDHMPDSILKDLSGPDRLFSAVVEQEIARQYPEEATRFFIGLRSEAAKAASSIYLIPPKNFHWIPGPYTHLAANLTAEHFDITKQRDALKPGDYRTVNVKSDLRHFMYRWLKTPALITDNDDFENMGIHMTRGIAPRLLNKVSLSADMNEMTCYSNNPMAPGGRMLVFGDSFANPLCQDMARYFQEVISVEYTAFCRLDPVHALDCLKQISDAYAPEYIVIVGHVSAITWAGEAAAILESLRDSAL